MLSISGEMIKANPVIGVGADNFGMQVNRYREAYGAENPDDVNLANAEDQIPEHAHNEFLQIVAELGVIGGAIFAWLLVGIAVLGFRAVRTLRSRSLEGAAAVLGLSTFLVSSMVSAYSFRVMQNGIVFFIVLAIATQRLLTTGERDVESVYFTPGRVRLAMAFGLLICLGLITYSGLRVGSAMVTTRANQTSSFAAALSLYDLAMRLDDENPNVRQNLGMRFFRNRRYAEAVPFLESAISIGRAPSSELSYLAATKSLAGDEAGAEETMSVAAALYPRSTFVLTKYASVLSDNGKTDAASKIFERAARIDERSARTWQALILSGPKALSDLAARDPGYSPVMQLQPQDSIYAVVTERLIKFPDEQRFSFAKPIFEEE